MTDTKPKKIKVLVCGGRDYTNETFLHAKLDECHSKFPIDVIIEGDCRGADRFAGNWAIKNEVKNFKFPADWDKHGKAAGFKRNLEMLDQLDKDSDLVIAFAGGAGTQHTIDNARKRGIKVIAYGGETDRQAGNGSGPDIAVGTSTNL